MGRLSGCCRTIQIHIPSRMVVSPRVATTKDSSRFLDCKRSGFSGFTMISCEFAPGDFWVPRGGRAAAVTQQLPASSILAFMLLDGYRGLERSLQLIGKWPTKPRFVRRVCQGQHAPQCGSRRWMLCESLYQ